MKRVMLLFVVTFFASSFVLAQQPDAKKETKKSEKPVLKNKTTGIDTCVDTKKNVNKDKEATKSVKKDRSDYQQVDTTKDSQKSNSQKKLMKKGHRRHYINSQYRY